MVNNLFECQKCGYIGIFLEVDKDEVKEVQKEMRKKGEDKIFLFWQASLFFCSDSEKPKKC